MENNSKNSKKPAKNAQKTKKMSEKKETKNKKLAPQKMATQKTKVAEKKTVKVATKVSKATKMVEQKTPKQVSVLGFHDLPLCTYLLDDVKAPKAVVVIVHGMQEHCLRYLPFAEFLNNNGYVVVLNDLRGHGKTMRSAEEYGRGEKDIFAESVQDELRLIDFVYQKYNLPIYVFGHSYGSMLTQKIVQLSPHVEKAVICGTTNGSCTLFALASGLVSALTPFNHKDKRGGLAEKLCIKSYGKKFERGNWLTRDEKVFDKYCADELCGGSFPFSFYRSMVKNMRKMNDGIQKIGNKKLFLIAGSCDPVGENGKQVKNLHKIYLKNNIDSKLKIYEGARHELLNETNKDEVFSDVLTFFEN